MLAEGGLRVALVKHELVGVIHCILDPPTMMSDLVP